MGQAVGGTCRADAQDVGEGGVGGAFAGAAIDLASFGNALMFGLKCS